MTPSFRPTGSRRRAPTAASSPSSTVSLPAPGAAAPGFIAAARSSRARRAGEGYQLPLTPREFFAAGIKAANEWTRKTYGKDFDRLSAVERDTALKAMDAGKAEFEEINAKQFFEMLLASAMEGFFADPMYGGNRDKISWRMVGYPGLPATYASKALEYRGKKIVLEPQSIADFS